MTERSKYIRYLGYELGEAPYEEFYDLERDPGETKNLAGDRAYAGQVEEARRRADYITDHYPAAQMTWATACAADRHIICPVVFLAAGWYDSGVGTMRRCAVERKEKKRCLRSMF